MSAPFDRTLIVRKGHEDRQFRIDNLRLMPPGVTDDVWNQEYVSFSGYFGPHNPNTFASAPKLLEACQNFIDYTNDNTNGSFAAEERLIDEMRAAISEATAEVES